MAEPVDEQNAGPSQRRSPPFQFPLWKLLLAVAACSLVFAVVSWGYAAMAGASDAFSDSYAAEAFLVLGLSLLSLGMCLRKGVLCVPGIIVLMAIFVVVGPSVDGPEIQTSPYIEQVAGFRVVDRATGEPVPGAFVRLKSVGSQRGVTTADGYVRLRSQFREPQYVDLGSPPPDFPGCTVEIEAEGYAPATCRLSDLPVDGEVRWLIKLPLPSGSSPP